MNIHKSDFLITSDIVILVQGISKFITSHFQFVFYFLQLFSILFRAFCIVYLSMQESQLVAGRWGRVAINRDGNPTAPSIVHFDVVTSRS